MKRKYRPTNATLMKVIKYMEDELNLRVYGDTVNLKTGENHGCCMDYSAKQVVKLRELVRKDAVWERGYG